MNKKGVAKVQVIKRELVEEPLDAEEDFDDELFEGLDSTKE